MTFTVQGTVDIDGKQAKDALKGIGDEAKKAGNETEGFGRKGRGAGAGAKALGNETEFAAGSVANLTAQFNDIGVMLAAGQSPLQLAIQQGTQITQVFGNAGAAQAGMMLKNALFSMISPLNLITIGGIAAGAALFQWATSADDASEKASTFEDRLDALDAAISSYSTSADLALMTTDQLREKFGYASDGLRLTIAMLEQISQNEAQRTIDGIAVSLGELMGIAGDGDQRTGIADFFDLNIGLAFTDQQRTMRTEARQLTAEFLSQQNALKGAAGDLDGQISIMRQMLVTAENLAAAKGDVSEAEEGVIKKIAETLIKMEEQRGKVQSVEDATLSLVDVANLLVDAAYAGADGFAAQGPAVASLLGQVQSLAAAAWDYAGALGASQEKGRRGAVDPRTVGGRAIDIQTAEAGEFLANYKPPRPISVKRPSSGGAGRSAAGTIEREQKAVDDLIASLTKQRDVIAETDPVQKEMIQNRKVLATATDAERQTVEDLIAARIAEEAAIDRATEKADFYGGVISNALDVATTKGNDLDDVLKNIAGSFIDAGIQAAIFGEGPFGSIFGGSSILDVIFPQKKADGGMIYGAGGGRDDKVPVMGSAGEFIVNASATSRNRALLESVNAGAPMQALAAGGMIGGGSAPSAASGMGGGNVIHLHYDLTGARGNTEIIEAVKEGIEQGLREYDREVLPGRVMEISENPRMVG